MRNKWWTSSLNHLEHQIVGNFFQNLHYNIFLKIMGKIFGWWKITLQGLQLTFQEYFESPFPHPGNWISYRSPAWWPQKKCRHTTALKFQGQSANQQVLFNQPRQWLIVHLSFKKMDWTLKSLFARQLSIEELTKRFPKFRPILLEENGFYSCFPIVKITLTPAFSGILRRFCSDISETVALR